MIIQFQDRSRSSYSSGRIAPIRRATLFAAMIVALLLTTLSVANADEFELADGRKLEGTIVRELGPLVSIKLVDGTIVTIEKSQIKNQKTTQTAFGEYILKRDKTAKTDPKAQYELALWCADKGLNPQATLHLKAVISLEPHHIAARERLGYVWIAGEWYLKDSPEAEARRKKSERLRSKPKVLTRDYKPRIPKAAPKPRSVRIDKDTVQILADEVINKKAPEVSAFYHRLRAALFESESTANLAWIPEPDKVRDGHLIEVKIRVYFLRTHMFYKKVPITNVFKGEAEAQIYRVENGKKTKIGEIQKYEVPFSASTQLEKEKAFDYAYYDTATHLVARLSRLGFFKSRGLKPIPVPDT